MLLYLLLLLALLILRRLVVEKPGRAEVVRRDMPKQIRHRSKDLVAILPMTNVGRDHRARDAGHRLLRLRQLCDRRRDAVGREIGRVPCRVRVRIYRRIVRGLHGGAGRHSLVRVMMLVMGYRVLVIRRPGVCGLIAI